MIRRLLSTLGVIWLAATLAFFALRVLPGDAIESQLIDSGAPAADLQQQRELYGLTGSLPLQYSRYLAGLLRGDLGLSLLGGEPVSEMIGQQLPATLALTLPSLALALMLGLLFGTLGALDIGFGVSTAARLITGLSLSTPIYWTGTLAIYVVTVLLRLPSGQSALDQLILPVAVLGFAASGAIARVTEAGVGALFAADFVRTARAKGLSERVILSRHVLRAALLPVITVTALQAGFLISGAVITETLFLRPGLGRLLLQSTLRQDYPVVQGIVVLSAVAYTLFNAAADGLYRLADPRVSS